MLSKIARYAKHAVKPTPGYDAYGVPYDAWFDKRYTQWAAQNKIPAEELERQRVTSFNYSPKFSIIVPLFKTPENYLREMADSVLGQTYPNFELILVNASPEIGRLKRSVERYRKSDSRIRVVTLESNLGITENTNEGIAVATGDFLCFLDHDDALEPSLLYEYAKALNENDQIDVLYCDEDLTDEKMTPVHPLFKPDFSPALLMSKNYIVHLMTIRKAIVDAMPTPTKEFDGAQDYNMVLYATEQARCVHHVNKVLYHWRMSNTSTAAKPEAKPYSRRAYRLSMINHYKRCGIPAKIDYSRLVNIYNPFFVPSGEKTVSIIVCATSKDTAIGLLDAIEQTNDYDNYELIIVGAPQDWCLDRHSSMPMTFVDGGFDTALSAFNRGAREAQGDYLLFLSDSDIPLTSGMISQLVGCMSIPNTGACAPKCLYADYTTKTFGVAVTPERIMPLFRGYADIHPGYQCNTHAHQNYSAVGLAGLTTDRELFNQIGGFDERFDGELGCVDYCRNILESGKQIVQSPTAKIMFNGPKPSDIYNNHVNAPDYADAEVAKFDKKWGEGRSFDPYFSKYLDQASSYSQIEGTA